MIPETADRMSLPAKRKQNPFTMLGGLFNANVSPSKYTQLSDLEDSSGAPDYGRIYPLSNHRCQVVAERVDRTVDGVGPSGSYSCCLWYSVSCKLYSILISSLCNALLITATTCLFFNP